jgi:hypothetical protein
MRPFPAPVLAPCTLAAAVALMAGAALGACGSPETHPVTPPAPTTSAPPPVASAAPTDTPPPPAPDAGASASSLPERSPLPFCVQAQYPSTPRLFRMQDDTLLVTTSEPATLCDRGGACADIPDKLKLPANLAMHDVIAAAGHWPSDAWMTLSMPVGEGTGYRVVHLADGRWREEARAERGWLPVYQRLATSPDGRVAGIATFQVDGQHATPAQISAGAAHAYRLDLLGGAFGAGLPAVANNETPFALALLRGGEALVIIERVVGEEGHSILLRRAAAGPKELVLPLPGNVAGVDVEVHALQATTGSVAYAAGGVSGVLHGYLARIEAGRAASVDVPDAVGLIEDIAVEPDETVWAVAGGRVFVRSPAGKWEHVTVSAEPGTSCSTTDIEARAAGDVYVSAKCDSGHLFVLRTRCP